MSARFKSFSLNTFQPASESFAAWSDHQLDFAAKLGNKQFVQPVADNVDIRFSTDEGAARHHLAELLELADDPDMIPTLAPDEPALLPGLTLMRADDSPQLGTKTLHFEQHSQTIPIFGTSATVEIDAGTRDLVSFDAQMANSPDVSHVASINPAEALDKLLAHLGEIVIEKEKLPPPSLCFFATENNEEWHLAYHFRDIPAAPEEVRQTFDEEHTGHLHAASPRDEFLQFDYMVDANTGEILYYFSTQPFVDIPVVCSGKDEDSVTRQFFGREKTNGFELTDPLRNTVTYDHGFKDITAPLTSSPIDNSNTDFNTSTPEGISAHYHAELVFDFFNNVMKRNGVDDKGMKLVSVVNCTYSKHGGGNDWPNAVWWKDRMWYGQVSDGNGGWDSFARHLDIIAHEMTHGVTQTTSNLVYRDESGALNESFSDIFGIMVANWYPGTPQPLANWNWELGSGLGKHGGPMRDLSNPKRTGHPDHWRDRKYIGTSWDAGGVHYNSNIHNKAAYNLFHSVDDDDEPVLSPEEIGLLYYVTLTRLSRRATFTDCLRTLRSVTASFFRGNPARYSNADNAIVNAYKDVGIR